MAKVDPKIEMLGRIGMFQGLSSRELGKILVVSKEVAFKEGQVMATEGETGNRMYLILEGTARVTINKRLRATFGPGDHFGEMALLDGGPRTATVTAQTPVQTLSLLSMHFTPLLKREPEITYKLLVEMTKRLRTADKALSA